MEQFYGFERDVNIAKRTLLINPNAGVDFHSIWPQFLKF